MCSRRGNIKRADFSSLAPSPVKTPLVLPTYISSRHTAIFSHAFMERVLSCLSSSMLILESSSSQVLCYHLSPLSCMPSQRYGYAFPVKPGMLFNDELGYSVSEKTILNISKFNITDKYS